MPLVIFNGSPRGKHSNSAILIDEFLKGHSLVNSSKTEINFLISNSDKKKRRNLLNIADKVIVILPLYCDSMPGIVMEFFEELYSIGLEGKSIGFIVQSGFPESKHSEALETYLLKFSKRLKAHYIGCIIRGGVEGIKIMHPKMTKKLFLRFQTLGKIFGESGEFNKEVKSLLGRPYTLSIGRRLLFSIASKIGITNFYWNMMLKKNGAFENRFNKPYIGNH